MMRKQARRRSGALYLSVLGTSVVVGVLALAGMHAARAHLATTSKGADIVKARLLAASAIELGVASLRDDSDWRNTFTVGAGYPVSSVAVNGGTYQWRLTDAGGLARTLQGAGVQGSAVCLMEVDLAQPPDLDCALVAGGDLSIDSGCTLTADAPIAVNGALTVDGAIVADVEAQSASGGGSVGGALTAPGELRGLPSADMVFDYYQKKGTPLTPGVMGGTAYVMLVAMSPYVSWGGANADGIYVLDSQGNDVSISSCRIVGTVVVPELAEGKKVTVSGRVNWEPAYPNYPALLVDGDLEINLNDGSLTESFVSPSYNPVGAPYQGAEDSDKSDSFPSSIAGLVYCTGDLTIRGASGDDRVADLRGVFIAGGDVTVHTNSETTIAYDSQIKLNPPPGFGKPETLVESSVSTLQDYSSYGTGTQDDLLADKWWGQYFAPTLPADAVSWRVTRVEVYARQGTVNLDFEASLYEPNESNLPSATVIDTVVTSSTGIGVPWGWQAIDFAGSTTIPAGEGVCLTLTTDESTSPLEVEYLPGSVTTPNSALITGDPTWNTFETDKALRCQVYGVYYTSTGASEEITIVPGSWRQVTF